MSLSIRIFDFFSFGNYENCEKETIQKIVLTNIFTSLGVAFYFMYTIGALLQGRLMLSIILGISSLLMIANLFVLHKTKAYKFSDSLLIAITSSTYLFLLITGGIDGTGFLWVFSFPILSMFLYGTKRGTIVSLIFWALMTIVLILQQMSLIPGASPFALATRVLSIYLLIVVMTYVYIFFKEQNFKEVTSSIQDAKSETKSKDEFISKLSHQIRTPLNNIMVLGDLISETNLIKTIISENHI